MKAKFSAIMVVLSIVLAANALAEDWYSAKLVQINPREGGDTYIQFKPGAFENRFSGIARGVIDGTTPGANRIMAVLLAACTLDTEVTILLDEVPSWNRAQFVLSAGMKME